MSTGKHIVFMGIGGVGGYTSGKLTRAGHNVTVIDAWPEHIDYIKKNGIHLSNLPGEDVVPMRALHMHEVQSLIRNPADIAIIATKSYDTEWAATMLRPYLAQRGYVVVMQNGSNEDYAAAAVGWGRTVGCILSTIGVHCYAPGHVKRIRAPGPASHAVYRVGEIHGRVTQRATELANILNDAAYAKVTTDLWSERWTKLTANTITHGLLGATGGDNRSVYLERGTAHRLGIKCGAEAVAVGRAQGLSLGTVLGMDPDLWVKAGGSDKAAIAEVQAGMTAWFDRFTEPTDSSVGRDVKRGRRSEVAYTSGLVARRGEEVGVPAPTHAALTAIVERIDRGELTPDPRNIEGLG